MTQTTDYSTITILNMLDRQYELQRLGRKMGHQDFDDGQLELAYIAEVGELVQEFKGDWAWWKKPGLTKGVDAAKVLDEASDVVHFALIKELGVGIYYFFSNETEEERRDELHWWDKTLRQELETFRFRDLSHLGNLTWLVDTGDFALKLNEVLSALAVIVHRVGWTPEDLVKAYYDKTQVNLDRWRAVASVATVNEARELNGLAPIGSEGDKPMNPALESMKVKK